MKTRVTWFLFALFLLVAAPTIGCPGGSLTVADDDDAQGDDDDTLSDDDTQGDDDIQGDDDDAQSDDDDSQSDDDDSPFAGEYEGEMLLSVESPQGPMVFEGPLLAIVNAFGAVTCHGEVSAPMDTVLVEIVGEVSDTGAFTGETYQAPANTPQQGPYATDGEFTPGGFQLQWTGSVPTPDGQEIPFVGLAEGWPL